MKVRISRWRGLLKTFRWKRLTIEWKVRAQNVLLDFKEYVVGFVQTDRAESHRMPERNLRCKCRYDRCEKLLRAVASGSGCYIHVVENTARNVKNAAQKKSGIKGEGALNKLAALFEIEEEDMYVRAEKLPMRFLRICIFPNMRK